MGLFDRFRPAPDPTVEFLQESIRDLSLRLEDRGWQTIGTDEESVMSREALRTAAQDGRALAVAHPLIRRGLSLRTSYIHGQGGPQITVDADTTQDVNAVVQAWWSSPENQLAVTGPEARARLERALSTDGNVFIACFTNPATGMVASRTLPFDEITRVITNPDDRMEPWFYERTRYVNGRDETVFYPDITYAPTSRPRMIDGRTVEWGAPVRHVKINDLDGWTMGVGDTVSVAPMARAYRDFLADWVRLTKSLSQFVWRATADGKRAAAARRALARVPSTGDSGVGASMVLGAGETLEAIPKTGATIDADSGRPLLAMIAAGLDVPVTMLSTDPGVTGARATAETLDRPMYLAMQARRDVWGAAYIDIAEYAVEQAIRAPQGVLRGEIVRDDWTRSDHAVLDGGEPTITVSWPDLTTESLPDMIRAIREADATEKIPPKTVARLLLVALSVDDVDEVLAEMLDEDGNWRGPYKDAGQALTAAYRAEGDPAQVLSQYGRFE